MILAKRYPDATYVVIADGEILAANVPRAVAHRSLRELVSGLEADRLLNTTVPDSDWRRAFIAAAVKLSVKACSSNANGGPSNETIRS